MGCAASMDSPADEDGRVTQQVKPAAADDRYRDDLGARGGAASSASAAAASPSPTRRHAFMPAPPESGLTPQELAQVEAIKVRRRSVGRPCSLAADDSMRHYRLVTGNIRDDDDYFDGSRIRVRSSSGISVGFGNEDTSSEGSSPLLSRRSSMRRTESFTSAGGTLRKSVSFHGTQPQPGVPMKGSWRPCVK